MNDTLEEALANGRGTERPFKCPEHDDTQASASVNIVKMVWFCHACQARGAVNSKRAPKIEELETMLSPEQVARRYPSAWLETFLDWTTPIYWDDRFPRWVSWSLKMGQDPFTGSPTFPVHTANGTLAGVGRRVMNPEMKQRVLAGIPQYDGDGRPLMKAVGPRYLYPQHWSAAVSLGARVNGPRAYPVLALVEGYADAAAVWQTGCPALAVYGSGLHLPQIEILAQHRPKVVLLGFDMDEAGEKAVTRAFSQIGRMAELVRVKWSANDPADVPLEARKGDLRRAVARSGYGGTTTTLQWDDAVQEMQARHAQHLQEIA